jgi:transcriptional regulator with XRE-family HTH domain
MFGRPWTKERLDQIRQLHAQGLTDREIGERLGISRSEISRHRRDLGLPVHWPIILRRALQAQLRSMGLRSPGEMRQRAYRRYARDNGWPEDLRYREVQILNALARQGPLTRLQLADAIGMRTDRIGGNGSAALLTDNGRAGTYTASLLRRGLIAWLGRRPGPVPGGLAGVYALTELALRHQEKFHGTIAPPQ